MDELVKAHNNNLKESLSKSFEILSKAVALPITVKDQSEIVPLLKKAISEVLK